MSAENDNAIVLLKARSEELSTNKIISALSAIAIEMKKFHNGTHISCHNFGGSQELCEKVSLCKSSIRLKKKQIRLLRENLRKACIVAKTVMIAKENETMSLHNHINSARSECADLIHKNKTSTEIINNLTLENRSLKDKINRLTTLIHLGYQELQKIRDRPDEDNIPIALQLKEIMISCGQYYADYSNEHEIRLKVEQKNRFLNNKVNIIGSNSQAIVEELKNLRYQNAKLEKENSLLRNKHKQIQNCPYIFDGQDFDENNTNMLRKNQSFNSSLQSMESGHSFDLTSHISLVKSLLNNQDNMLKDLRVLSEKLSII